MVGASRRLSLLTLPLFWAVCAAVGYLYVQPRGVPDDVVWRVAPAFLLEATLFLMVGVERWRRRLEKLPKLAIAGALTGAAVAPYVLASVATGTFAWTSLFTLVGLAAVLSFWYVLLPHNPISDIALLIVAAGVVLSKIFASLYVRPHPGLAMEALGQAMWIRTGLFAIVSVRRVQGVGFGFWPNAREWRIGALHFAVLLPVVGAVAWLIGFVRPHAPEGDWPLTLVLTFFGTLWVLALGEELFFRGLLQQWFTRWLKSEWGGLAAASLVFGVCHLPFNVFPNWRFALLATIAGAFYGHAYQQGRGIRAAMVVHACTVTVMKAFYL